jgi:2'-5' RNA ligase
VWIGALRGEPETAAVVSAVGARLDPIVGAEEPRPFRTHLTVARVKEAVPFDWDAAFAPLDVRSTTTRVDHVTLYQSRSSPKGPTYTALCATPLATDTHV